MRGLEEQHKRVSDKLDAAFQALEDAQKASSLHDYQARRDYPPQRSSSSIDSTSIDERKIENVPTSTIVREEEELELVPKKDIDNEKDHPSLPLRQVDRNQMNEKQAAVVNAIEHAWKAYKSNAWGR